MNPSRQKHLGEGGQISRRRPIRHPRFYDRSDDSVMIRELDGSIRFWNRAAEKQYGWTKGQAIGSVSHHLLNTVFPCPLIEINQQLLDQGWWEGELIHSLNDGLRVKVFSRWELRRSEKEPAVVEINKLAEVINPETAHLIPESGWAQRLKRVLVKNLFWWLVPLIACLVLFGIILEFTQHAPLAPIFN